MKLMSLLICLAMLLSGFAVAEEAAAPASTVVTVRDAILTIQEEEYPLNPALVFGLSADESSALIDFGMPLGNKVLFPVQARIDTNGAAVLLGDSETAYTFSPEFFESLLGDVEIPAELIEMGEAYVDLLSAAMDLDRSVSTEMNINISAELLNHATVTEGGEAEFEIDFEPQTGKQYTLELSNEQVKAYMDAAYAQLPAEFTDAYFRFVNAAYSMAGMPEINAFSELMDLTGMNVSITGELVGNDTCGIADLVLHFELDPSQLEEALTEAMPAAEENAEATEEASVGIIGGADGPTSVIVTGVSTTEPVSFDLPMTVTVHSPEHAEVYVEMEVEGVHMEMLTAQHTDGIFTVSGICEISGFGYIFTDFYSALEEDGSTSTDFVLSSEFTDGWFVIQSENAALDGSSTTNVAFNSGVDDESALLGLSFSVDVTDDAIEDRIAAAEPKVINTLEETEESSGLMMAAMGLIGDVEPLLNDESIAAAVEAAQALFDANTMAPVLEEAVLLEEYPADENTEVTAAPAFTAELGWMPEGYQIEESEYDADYGCYSFVLLHADDVNYDYPVYINVYSYEEPAQTPDYFDVSGDEIKLIDGAPVQLYHSEDDEYQMRNAYANFGPHDVDLYAYGDSLTDEDLVRIVAGVTLSEIAE